MSTDRTIDYVEFPAEDFDLVQKFYSQTFRWAFTDYGPDYRAFTDETLSGGFYKSTLKSTTSSGAALLVLFADDLEALQQEVEGNGGRIHKKIFSFPGGRRFHFLDPHGNELAVWSDK